ncbi:hypothetical protein U1Q18_018858 [Sarracenia purpurea var. burkii]
MGPSTLSATNFLPSRCSRLPRSSILRSNLSNRYSPATIGSRSHHRFPTFSSTPSRSVAPALGQFGSQSGRCRVQAPRQIPVGRLAPPPVTRFGQLLVQTIFFIFQKKKRADLEIATWDFRIWSNQGTQSRCRATGSDGRCRVATSNGAPTAARVPPSRVGDLYLLASNTNDPHMR